MQKDSDPKTSKFNDPCSAILNLIPADAVSVIA